MATVERRVIDVYEGFPVEELRVEDTVRFIGPPALQTQSLVVERTDNRAVLLTDRGSLGLVYSQFDDSLPGDSEELYIAENVRERVSPGQKGYDEASRRLVDLGIASEIAEVSAGVAA